MKTQEQSQEQVQEVQKQDKKKKPVDPAKYEQYVSLKFLVLDGAQLKDVAQKELEQLEKEILSCTGKMPNKTVTASFGSRYIKLVKDVPVPQEIYDFISESGKAKHYFA